MQWRKQSVSHRRFRTEHKVNSIKNESNEDKGVVFFFFECSMRLERQLLIFIYNYLSSPFLPFYPSFLIASLHDILANKLEDELQLQFLIPVDVFALLVFFLFKQYLKLSICSRALICSSRELVPLHNSHFNTPRSKSYNKLLIIFTPVICLPEFKPLPPEMNTYLYNFFENVKNCK